MDFKPTSEQQRLIEAPVSARLLVLAGAGTGKTESLVRRLKLLLETEDLGANQVLVLSFSRAAVLVLRDRLAQMESEAKYIRAATFDSFATRLLIQTEEPEAFEQESFEARIRHATRLIEESEEVESLIATFKLIVVDEIQDLVGVRAQFVKALLGCAKGGFTLLGDPAQGIYEWQDKSKGSSSRDFLRWLKKAFERDLETLKFTENFRFETKQSKVALEFREQLLEEDGDAKSTKAALLKTLIGLPTSEIANSQVKLKRSSDLAILCRSNAHVAAISRELNRLGILHEVQRSATDRMLPAWLAIILRNVPSSTLSKVNFLELCDKNREYGPPDVERSWNLLKRLDSKNNAINLRVLVARLREGNYPDELNVASRCNLTVSTIHHAKGLEFQDVLVSHPDDAQEREQADDREEAHVLYVALTRARRYVDRLNAPKHCFAWAKDNRCRIEQYFKGRRWPTDVEILGDDAYREDPAGAYGFSADVHATQLYIQKHVKQQDEVELRRISVAQEGKTQEAFVTYHGEIPVGVTSPFIWWSLKQALLPQWAPPSFDLNWPDRILGLRVQAVDSVAGMPITSRKYNLGDSGLWLRVRVAGLGKLKADRGHR